MPVLRIVPALLSFTAGFVDSCTFQRAAPLDHYHQRDRHQRDLLRQYRRQHIDRNVSRRHRGLVDHAQHDRRHLLHGGRDNAERDGCGDVLMRGFAGLLAAWLALSPAFADSAYVAPTATGQAATGQIPGTATNDSASTGNVGGYISASVGAGSAVSLTTATPANVTSVSLSAGEWDYRGSVEFTNNASTTASFQVGGINTASATLPAMISGFGSVQLIANASANSAGNTLAITSSRVSISGTITVYLEICREYCCRLWLHRLPTCEIGSIFPS